MSVIAPVDGRFRSPTSGGGREANARAGPLEVGGKREDSIHAMYAEDTGTGASASASAVDIRAVERGNAENVRQSHLGPSPQTDDHSLAPSPEIVGARRSAFYEIVGAKRAAVHEIAAFASVCKMLLSCGKRAARRLFR